MPASHAPRFVAEPDDAPSGNLQIYSETIASFGEADCPGHPTWLGPVYIPTDTLCQLDFGGHSFASK
ncbi:hypothetical protein [Ensifer aridi]|uniref:hypothetical protein n=1 Tax=Ensifer aridi TaxID=1708715 RepID=UPI000A0F4383|nr:hypothetical protein [Ensifer aridi]